MFWPLEKSLCGCYEALRFCEYIRGWVTWQTEAWESVEEEHLIPDIPDYRMSQGCSGLLFGPLMRFLSSLKGMVFRHKRAPRPFWTWYRLFGKWEVVFQGPRWQPRRTGQWTPWTGAGDIRRMVKIKPSSRQLRKQQAAPALPKVQEIETACYIPVSLMPII